jgi:hypothetical protein
MKEKILEIFEEYSYKIGSLEIIDMTSFGLITEEIDKLYNK